MYLTGDNATEASFKQLVGDFEIIHLAVHGIGDPQEALNSRLEFRSAGDTVNDGKIFAHELYPLKLDKLRLAVLSACESGIVKEQAGEGIFSMARGFAYAGSPSMVMSLWDVDDRATSRLMELFYGFLSQGNSVSEAIRQAKLQYIKDSDDSRLANHYYWAAFIPLGDTKPVIKKNNYFCHLIYM